jgi:nucleoid DNA-binding protein/cell division septation protein DedD
LKKILIKHIIELLKNHECVTIPNFGGFILKPVSAGIQNNVLSPPHKQIGFNKSLLQDDGLLTGAIMGSESLDYLKAQNEVNKFSNSINFSLKRDGEYALEGIGKFFMTDAGMIKFQATSNAHLDKNSFGFQNLTVQPIVRDVIAEKKKNIAEQKTKKINAIAPVKKYQAVLAIVTLLMTGIFALMLTDTHIKGTKIENANFLSILFPADTQMVTPTRTSSTIAEMRTAPPREELAVPSFEFLKINNQNIPSGYFVVVGSYASLTNAERMEKELFAKGYDSYISESGNGFFRVTVFASGSYIDAAQKLEAMKKENQDYWLVKNL